MIFSKNDSVCIRSQSPPSFLVQGGCQRETNSSGTILAEYSYNGTSTPVISDYQTPDVKLDLYGGTSGTYAAFDRFGRTIDHRWIDYAGAAFDVDRIKHGYDYAGNRLWREDTVAAAQMTAVHQDEFYTYDALHRLKNGQRGNLTGSPYTGVTSRNLQQDWTLNQLGNWATFKQDDDGGGTWDLDQSRDHNAVNELTDFTTTTWVDPVYDAAGNMTTIPKPGSPTTSESAVYDAWNRQVDYGGRRNEYDGLNRRITEGTTFYRSNYHNENWQVIDDQLGVLNTSGRQLVWHPYYIDALAVTYAISSGDRHYYLQDANFNVTAAIEDDGDVVERYRYTPYGEPKFLNADFSVKGSQTSAIGNEILYTGRERDASTGLQLNRNRFYHNRLGRWLTRDPIGYEGSQWNLFEYVRGRVTNAVDPSGEICIVCTCAQNIDGRKWIEYEKTVQCPPHERASTCCKRECKHGSMRSFRVCDADPGDKWSWLDCYKECNRSECQLDCFRDWAYCNAGCFIVCAPLKLFKIKYVSCVAACRAGCDGYAIGCVIGCERCKD